MVTYLKIIVLVLILLLLSTFGVKNNQPVRLYYYFNFETFEIPVYAMIYVFVAVGIFIGMMVGISTRLHLRRTVKTLRRDNRDLQEKVKEEMPQKEPSIPSPAEPVEAS